MDLLDRDLRTAMLLAVVVYAAAFAYGYSRPAIQLHEAGNQTLVSWDIFKHNVAALSPLWLGVFSYGAITVVWLLFQGLLHGSAVGASGLSPLQALALLFPHGYFELPAIWLAAGAGMAPGVALLRNQGYPLFKPLKLLPVWLGLLAAAALLEGGGR